MVDDGSTDATAQVVAEAAQFLPLTCVRHARAQGRSAAANAGARAASGEILIFLDGDMPVAPNFALALPPAALPPQSREQRMASQRSIRLT